MPLPISTTVLRSGRVLHKYNATNLADRLAREETRETTFAHGPTRELPIQPFDGIQNFELFYERFMMVKEAKGWSDDDAAKWFPLCLTTVPLSFYRTLTACGQKGDIKAGVPDAFRKEFMGVESQSQNLNRLALLKQVKSETVNEFYQRLIGLAYNAYDKGLDPLVRDSLCMSHFINGLNAEMAVKLKNYAPENLRDAVRIAKNLEAAQVHSTEVFEPQVTHNERKKSHIVCHRCGKIGHVQRECFYKYNRFSKNISAFRQNNSYPSISRPPPQNSNRGNSFYQNQNYSRYAEK